MLNNHRLIYFPETPDAPDVSSFKTTVKRFISDQYRGYIDQLWNEAKARGETTTKKALQEENESPTLEIIPLTGRDSISAFVNQFSLLKTIEFRIVKPNSEVDGHEVFKQLREISDELNSTSTKLRASNPDGLDKDNSKKTITDATDQGNQEVTLDGLDQDGNKLKGNNDEFKISAPLATVPVMKLTLAKKLFGIFEGLVANGTIKIGNQTKKVTDVVQSLTK